MSERLHVHKKALSQSDSTPVRSQFQTRPFTDGNYARQPGLPVVNQLQPRPFAVQTQPGNSPKTQQEIENEAFQQDKHEAFGLELQAKYGNITPEGQERLSVLQAKMDAFWQQRRESTRGINLLEIPNLFAPRETIAPSSIQQQLTIGQPGDKYEQEANQVAEQDDLRLIMPPLKQVGLGHGDESEQARFLTLPSAAPVFATQPD